MPYYRLLILVIVTAALLFNTNSDKIVFLAVGQGDAILLQTASTQILIDGGPGNTVLSKLGQEMPWFDKTIEIVILTHPQRDHLEGLVHVLDRYNVNLILLPGFPYHSQLQAAWLDKIRERGIPYRFAWAGQSLLAGMIKLQVLSPQKNAAMAAAIKTDINNVSTVTRVDFHHLSLLLTGDVEKRVETILVNNTAKNLLDVDVLKVGHHGSNSSTHPAFIVATSPRAAVISVGADNKFGHPDPAVLARLAGIPLWRTDRDGSIRLKYLADRWYINAP